MSIVYTIPELKLPYTYRIQLLPHQYFEVVLFMQQVKYVGHLVIPSDASEEAHLGRARAACVSSSWSSLSQPTIPLQCGCFQMPSSRGAEGLMPGRCSSLPPPFLWTQQGPLWRIQKGRFTGTPGTIAAFVLCICDCKR